MLQHKRNQTTHAQRSSNNSAKSGLKFPRCDIKKTLQVIENAQ